MCVRLLQAGAQFSAGNWKRAFSILLLELGRWSLSAPLANFTLTILVGLTVETRSFSNPFLKSMAKVGYITESNEV